MSITVGIIFSSDSVALFHEEGLRNIDVLNDVKTFSFNTPEEANAFLHAVDDSVGYDECHVKKVKPNSTFALISFGTEEGKGHQYLKVEQDSAAARIAYEAGVIACEGWFGYHHMDDQDLENYQQALVAANSVGNKARTIEFIQDRAEDWVF